MNEDDFLIKIDWYYLLDLEKSAAQEEKSP
jgi:hypothetical protein